MSVKRADKHLDQAFLRYLFDYDHETGVVTWRNAKRAPNGTRAGRVEKKYGYRRLTVGTRDFCEHRIIWVWMTGSHPPKVIDHVNRDPADNRWCNLREASSPQNRANARICSSNTSGYRGVRFNKKDGRWHAKICGSDPIFLGCFDTAEEAVRAYDREAQRRFGEFHKPRVAI